MTRREGIARLESERRLVKLYKAEYERLKLKRGHVEAVRSLVRSHKTRFNAIVSQIRDERRSPRSGPEPPTGSSRAA